jgi:hypothetical protein
VLRVTISSGTSPGGVKVTGMPAALSRGTVVIGRVHPAAIELTRRAFAILRIPGSIPIPDLIPIPHSIAIAAPTRDDEWREPSFTSFPCIFVHSERAALFRKGTTLPSPIRGQGLDASEPAQQREFAQAGPGCDKKHPCASAGTHF